MRKNQKGLGAIEELLILVIVGLVGFTGWYVWRSKQSTDKTYSNAVNSASSTTATKAQKTTDPYAKWKTFCSSATNACFKYDPSWTFVECSPAQVNMNNYFQDCGPIENISLISPHGTRIDWYLLDVKDPSIGQCANDPSKVSYTDITQVPDVKNLYYVNINDSENIVGGHIERLTLRNGDNGQPPTPSITGAICPGFDYFTTQDGKYIADFSLNYSVNDKPQFNTEIPNEADLPIVKQILLSFYYK